jgi:hypothetical protein
LLVTIYACRFHCCGLLETAVPHHRAWSAGYAML